MLQKSPWVSYPRWQRAFRFQPAIQTSRVTLRDVANCLPMPKNAQSCIALARTSCLLATRQLGYRGRCQLQKLGQHLPWDSG
jgi:hypothetical protein